MSTTFSATNGHSKCHQNNFFVWSVHTPHSLAIDDAQLYVFGCGCVHNLRHPQYKNHSHQLTVAAKVRAHASMRHPARPMRTRVRSHLCASQRRRAPPAEEGEAEMEGAWEGGCAVRMSVRACANVSIIMQLTHEAWFRGAGRGPDTQRALGSALGRPTALEKVCTKFGDSRRSGCRNG